MQDPLGGLVNKLKQIIKQDKARMIQKNEDNNNNNLNQETEIDNNFLNNKFNEKERDYNSFQISTKSERNYTKKHFSKSFSESQMLTLPFSSHSHNKQSELKPQQFFKSKRGNYEDQIITIIKKATNYIETNKENSNLNIIVDYLNEILELYINSLSEKRINAKKNNENEILIQAKVETMEKLVRSSELKYLTSEKEKTKISKQFDSLSEQYNQLKEKNEHFKTIQDEIITLERNNNSLLQTNNELRSHIEEMNLKNDFVKKKYEEEIKEIRKMLNLYKEGLERIEKKISQNSENNLN